MLDGAGGRALGGVRVGDRARLPGRSVADKVGKETPGEGVAFDEEKDDAGDDELQDAVDNGER